MGVGQPQPGRLVMMATPGDMRNGIRLVDDDIGASDADQAEGTGDARVDEALGRLGELADLPVSQHPQVFERIHASLVDVLGELRPGVADDRRTQR